VKELGPSDIQNAGVVLDKAFFDDPWVQYLLPEVKTRSISFVWFAGLMVEYGVKHGRVYGSYDYKTSQLQGVSVWQPPYEAGVSVWAMLRLGLGLAPFKFGFYATYKTLLILQMSEKLHQDAMKGKKHWSLYTIGVSPEYQCKGIGTSLIEPVLNFADIDNLPCYLDTASERSLNFFKRYGWNLHDDVVNPPVGCRFWTMVREPLNNKKNEIVLDLPSDKTE